MNESPPAIEVNFDGIVGPTHNYAGLALGNLASQRHRHAVSNPRAAALQGLAKMKFMMSLGIAQAVLPPHDRPDVAVLREAGFTGDDAAVLERAHRQDPALLAAASSASAMWAANAATVSPSADAADHRIHFTPANLLTNRHRRIEAPTTTRILRAIFAADDHFVVHDPLPCDASLGDEGAANHTRLCRMHGETGIELFVYGRDDDPRAAAPKRFPARQCLAASRKIAAQHGLDPAHTIYARQHPDAIDAGVFHNDVISVGNQDVLLLHERAYVDVPGVIEQLRRAFVEAGGGDLCVVEARADELPLSDVVDSYVFNSQLVTLPDGAMAMVCPTECERFDTVQHYLTRVVNESAGRVARVHHVDVRQSMNNGGGPACLRLRVVMTDAERAAAHQGVFLNESLHDRLVEWVRRHYRDELRPDDLADVHLLHESRAALDELTRLLDLGDIYPFQR